MRIFGFNILSDRKLNEIKSKSTFESVLKYLKIKKLYRTTFNLVQQPKCDKCNDNRQYVITLPDGRTITQDCSCKRELVSYGYEEIDTDEYNIIIHKLSGEIYLMKESEYEDSRFYSFDTLDNFDNLIGGGLYTSKSKAKKAAKILNEREKEREREKMLKKE